MCLATKYQVILFEQNKALNCAIKPVIEDKLVNLNSTVIIFVNYRFIKVVKFNLMLIFIINFDSVRLKCYK